MSVVGPTRSSASLPLKAVITGYPSCASIALTVLRTASESSTTRIVGAVMSKPSLTRTAVPRLRAPVRTENRLCRDLR